MRSGDTATSRPALNREPGKAFGTKTYVVLQRQFRGPNDRRPNVKVLAVKLTYGAADSLKQVTPGSWIERHDADKKHYEPTQSEAAEPGLMAPVATGCTETEPPAA